MEINICHLYPDLLNVYGDFGNILILKYRCEMRNIKVTITNISLNDEFIPEDYDIVFFGGGQDYEQSIVSPDLFAKRDKLNEYINSGKVFLAICGGYQLLGSFYETPTKEKIEGLKILDLYTLANETRFIGNTEIESEIDGKTFKFVGFENHSGKTYLGESLTPLGKVIHGFGNNGEDQSEGAIFKNTYCTYFHGSLLSKAPELADKLIKEALSLKNNENVVLEPLDDTFENQARDYIIKKLNTK